MNPSLRIVLVVGAVGTLALICRSIHRKTIQVEDSLFWVVFSAILVVLAIFPQIAYGLSGLLGIRSPSNFVFMAITAVLLLKEFRNTSKISVLKFRLNQLAQQIALTENADKAQTLDVEEDGDADRDA